MNVLSFKSPLDKLGTRKKSWNNQEIADFYRAVEILRQAGLNTEVDSGVTDEGDPWLVFLRPETGDVIAHFAQIDGIFLAVSSLNSEVYKGQNIRVIVDQMLERHPALLPQSKTNGKLYLHPTAALTAFLAAAFILTIDGIKADNLGDVIAAASSHDIPDLGGRGVGQASSQKADNMKVLTQDLSSANYNMAVLGAALILHELGVELDDNGEQFQPEELNAKSSLAKGHSERDIDNAALAGDTANFSLELKQVELIYKGELSHLKLYDQIESLDGSEQGEQQQKKDVRGSELPLFSELAGNIDISDGRFTELGGGAQNPQEKEYAHVKSGSPSGHLGFGKTVDHDLLPNAMLSVPVRVTGFDDESGFSPVKLNLPGDVTVDQDLELRFTEIGDVKLIAIDAIHLGEELSLLSGSSIAIIKKSADEPQEVVNNQTIDHVAVSSETDGFENNISLPVPIMGHSFINPNNVLEMTEAIDVVFYKGGDAEISGFELGKDLLWFFVPQEEVTKAQNVVNDKGDLTLDFGEIGALTFLGVVAQTNVDFIV